MIRSILRGRIESFERTYHYDAGYLRDLLEVAPSAFLRFGLVTSLGNLPGAPAAARTAAALVGTIVEDCGPCTQIGVDIGAQHGVAPEVLRAILAGDLTTMGEDAALAYRFARASLTRSVDADPLREQVVARWGKAGLVSIALSLMAARTYPTLKYALGHGRACTRVEVAGEPVRVVA